MQKHEANFGLTFRSWFRANKKKFDSSVFELKDTRGKKFFDMSEWKEAQRDHLEACRDDGGDLMRFSSGTTGMPDYGFYRNAYAYVVIKYPDNFYIIGSEDLAKWKLKTLKENEADVLSVHKVCL